MSWVGHAEMMIGDRKGTSGGLYGFDGNEWGVAGGLKIESADIITAADILKTKEIGGRKIKANGVEYMILRCDEDGLRLKRKDHGGLTIVQTKQCIVVGHYGEGMQAGDNVKAVFLIKEYLESVGY